jgi:hypothetical protein
MGPLDMLPLDLLDKVAPSRVLLLVLSAASMSLFLVEVAVLTGSLEMVVPVVAMTPIPETGMPCLEVLVIAEVLEFAILGSMAAVCLFYCGRF